MPVNLASSTPNIPRRRRGLRRNLEDTATSPITADSSVENPDLRHKSENAVTVGLTEDEEEYDSDDSNLDNSKSEKETTLIKSQSCKLFEKKIIFVLGSLVLLPLIVIPFLCVQPEPTMCSIEYLQTNLHQQPEDLWMAIDSGVNNIETFHRPSILMLVYNEQSKTTLQQVLKHISNHIMCCFNMCSEQPIVLTSEQLRSTRYQNDYGKVLTDYEKELEAKQVMIVQDIQDVPGFVALAFHSICDQYSPLVAKAFIILTMKMDQEVKDISTIEQVLQQQWNNITTEHFAALFTRIADMYFVINAET